MKMKRVVSTLLAGIMTLSLVACGGSAPATPTDSGSTEAPAAQTETAAPAAKTTKIGFVVINDDSEIIC